MTILNEVPLEQLKVLQSIHEKLEDEKYRQLKKNNPALIKKLFSYEGAANLLNTLPGAERIRVIKLLSNPSQWKPGAGAVAVNMLAPESTNQNALAQ